MRQAATPKWRWSIGAALLVVTQALPAQARGRRPGGGALVFAPVVVKPGKPPSPTAKRAIRAYANRRYRLATVLLHQVLRGKADGVQTKERAIFFQGKALYHLRLYVPALAYFSRIVDKGEAHKYYRAALIWLVSLNRKPPGNDQMLKQIGKYPLSVLNWPPLARLQGELRFHLGRFYFSRGDAANFDTALKLLGAISPRSRYYVRAQALAGITAVRRHRLGRALAAFKRVLLAVERARPRTPALARLDSLAKINMARLFYQAGHIGLFRARRRRSARATALRQASRRMFSLALKYYDVIPVQSKHWASARFEKLWTFYMLDVALRRWQKPRLFGFHNALGNGAILPRTTLDPALVPPGQPELIRAAMYLMRCRYPAARALLRGIKRTTEPLYQALRKLVKRHPDDNSTFSVLARKIRAGKANLGPKLARLLRRALSDRTLDAAFAWVRALDQQLARVRRAPASWRTTAIASEVTQELALNKSLAVAYAGQISRNRLKRLTSGLRDMRVRRSRLAYELFVAKRKQRRLTPGRTPLTRSRALDAAARESGIGRWPFAASPWGWERSYYRFGLRARCPTGFQPRPWNRTQPQAPGRPSAPVWER